MHFSKRMIWTGIATALVLCLAMVAGVGIGIVKFWPVARNWTQNVLGAGNVDAARKVAAQAGALFGNDRMAQLSRAGDGVTAVTALAGQPQMAETLKWTAALPALGPLVQNGGYQKALEEAVRQGVPNIALIRLDQVASPETRALLAEVQQAFARNPQIAQAASTVNSDVLNLLKSEAFARLCNTPGFAALLSGSEPAKEAE